MSLISVLTPTMSALNTDNLGVEAEMEGFETEIEIHLGVEAEMVGLKPTW